MKLVMAMLLVFVACTAVADSSLTARPITMIETGYGGEGVYFHFATNEIVEGCGNGIVYLDPANPMYWEILSMAVAAQQSGKNVQFRISGCFGINMNAIAVNVSG